MAEADISGRYYQPPDASGVGHAGAAGNGSGGRGLGLAPQHLRKGGKQSAVKTVLLVGAHRSGKTSIQRVVFNKMSPHETLFLESTGSQPDAPGPEVKLISYNSWVQLEVWDFPGDYRFQDGAYVDGVHFSEKDIFSRASAIVFVMDAQDAPYTHAIELLHDVVLRSSNLAPGVPVEVFVHKMDGDLFQSLEHRSESHARFQGQVEQELVAGGVASLMLAYHQTSIYDHSIFDAFSRVLQKMLPSLPTLVALLDTFVRMCDAEKAFLCDVVSKLYLATDSSPMDDHTHELCSDMLDVIVDVSCIYGEGEPEPLPGAPAGALQGTGSINAGGMGPGPEGGDYEEEAPPADAPEPIAFDSHTESTIRLGNGMALFLRQVSPAVALVALIKQEALDTKGLVSYNVDVLKRSLREVFSPTGPNAIPAGVPTSAIPIAGASAIVGSYPPPSSMGASWGGRGRMYGSQTGGTMGSPGPMSRAAGAASASLASSERQSHTVGIAMQRHVGSLQEQGQALLG